MTTATIGLFVGLLLAIAAAAGGFAHVWIAQDDEFCVRGIQRGKRIVLHDVAYG